MFTNLKELIQSMPSEEVCREYLAKQRWHDGKAVCPYCECGKCYVIYNGKKYKCSKCRKIFTVTVGTIFESSNIPLSKWFLAIYLIGSHKKGISSYQVAKDCGLSQKTGWFMLHRIRELMRQKENIKLDNIVEVDEVYMGGKVSNMSKKKRTQLREEGNTMNTKTMVLGMIERGGNLKLLNIGKSNNIIGIRPAMDDNIDKDAVILTDSMGAYTGLNKEYAGHEVVNHSEQEYVRDSTIHTNTIEGAFSHFRRSIYGVYHFCTPKHLSRYCDETAFRYNLRKMPDSVRFNYALQNASGRLKWKTLTDKSKDTPESKMAITFTAPLPVVKKHKLNKPIAQIKNGQIIAVYGSLLEAEEKTGIKWQNISRVCRGLRVSTGGYHWKYA